MRIREDNEEHEYNGNIAFRHSETQEATYSYAT
jgi:hypothetical protein